MGGDQRPAGRDRRCGGSHPAGPAQVEGREHQPRRRRSLGRAVPAVRSVRDVSAVRAERGATTIELALYMPLLLFVIFATVQAALLFLGNQAASAAAREAARVARTSQDIGAAEARGRAYAAQVGRGVIEDVSVQVSAVGADEVRAVVTGKGIQLVPGIPGLRIEQVVQGPVEEFRPDL
ncbi:TadE/TadG family type IV pilus assembly protein [Kineosporia babensis]